MKKRERNWNGLKAVVEFWHTLPALWRRQRNGRRWQQRIDSMSHDEFEAFVRVLDSAAQSKAERARGR